MDAIWRWLAQMRANQKIRYLVVGGCNTAFGCACFALTYFFFGRHFPPTLILAATNFVTVTFAFTLYKIFVFQTKGNVVREYFRFWGVYGVGVVVGLGVFAFCVQVLSLNPYLAQIVTIVFTTILSFLGHKTVSFKQNEVVVK